MKVALIDDEYLALSYLESKLQQIEGVEIAAKYEEAESSIQQIVQLKPDVIFLDINMPGINGLHVAERMMEHLPRTDIVFVTAYDKYAVQAFELNAIDYLLKPVTTERLRKTVERIMHKRLPDDEIGEFDGPVRIQCFRHFSVTPGGSETITWRTNKAKELFAYLLHHRDRAVHKDIILETLWPDVDIKKAHNQLYTTVYQVRKALQKLNRSIRLESKNGSYQLNIHHGEIDIDLWESALKQAPPFASDHFKEHLNFFDQYIGDYFEEEGYLWAEGERERLRTLWYHHALEFGEQLTLYNQFEAAFEVYRRLRENFPFSEKVYFHMMQMYGKMGDRASVERCYKDLLHMLKTEFGMPPQPETVKWYRSFAAAIN